MKEKHDETALALKSAKYPFKIRSIPSIFSVLLDCTNLRHLPTVVHEFSVKAARKTFGPQILTRMLVLIVTGFRTDVRSREEERSRSVFRASLERKKSRKRKQKSATTPGRRERELEGATHPEYWTTWRESGTIYMGAPPQSRSAPQEARRRPARLVSSLFFSRFLSSPLLAHRFVRDDTAVNKPLGDPTCWQST